jgi:cobalt/nickel transport system permease protein
MLGIHALIGIGEALITVAALAFILQTRPDILMTGKKTRSRAWIAVGVLVTLAVVLISPLASADPDGLERVAIDLGFIDLGADAPYHIIPDYTLPFLGETPLSTILAGVIGLVIVAAFVVGLTKVLKPGPKSSKM